MGWGVPLRRTRSFRNRPHLLLDAAGIADKSRPVPWNHVRFRLRLSFGRRWLPAGRPADAAEAVSTGAVTHGAGIGQYARNFVVFFILLRRALLNLWGCGELARVWGGAELCVCESTITLELSSRVDTLVTRPQHCNLFDNMPRVSVGLCCTHHITLELSSHIDTLVT